MAITSDGNGAHTANDSLHTDDSASNPSAVNRITEKAHETVDRVAASAGNAEEALRARAADAEARMRDMGAKISGVTQENTAHLRTYVRENPLMSAGIAFAVGYVFSVLMRR